jgi:hypothetical protein
MSEAICSFCGLQFRPGGTEYIKITSIEASPTQFQMGVRYNNLMMCFNCFETLQKNVAYNARNFRIDI